MTYLSRSFWFLSLVCLLQYRSVLYLYTWYILTSVVFMCLSSLIVSLSLFLIPVLLSYNSQYHTIHLLKWYNSMVFSVQNCATINLFYNTFKAAKWKPINSNSPFSFKSTDPHPSPQQQQIYSWSLWIFPFCTFQINRII